MGIKRVTLRIRPGIITGLQFIEKTKPIIQLLKEKSSHFYAWCFEENNADAEIMIDDDSKEFHFHGCFITWKNEGNSWYEKEFQKVMDWEYFVENKTVDKNCTRPALLVNGMTRKLTEMEFVGYLFKEPSTQYQYNGHDRSHCFGWDKEACLDAYNKGLQEAKIGWHTVYEYANEEYYQQLEYATEEYRNEKHGIDILSEVALQKTTKNIIRKYKETVGIGMVLNIRKLLEKTI